MLRAPAKAYSTLGGKNSLMNARSTLLNNVLDALDRLFDRKAGVAEVYDLICQTSEVLKGDELIAHFAKSANGLQALMQEGLPSVEERDKALDITNDLRIALAESLPWPENSRA